MRYDLLWMSEHRGLLLAAVAAFFWLAANYWYWRRDIQRILRENKPHSWSVNMAAKTGTGRKRVG